MAPTPNEPPDPVVEAFLALEARDTCVILEPRDLATMAARAAATVLAGNWSDAIADEDGRVDTVGKMLDDVDDVIHILREWRNAAASVVATGTLLPPSD